jgi:hypothetical protein
MICNIVYGTDINGGNFYFPSDYYNYLCQVARTGYDHTDALLDRQKVLKVKAEFVSGARLQIDVCTDSCGPSLVIENAPLMDLVSEARARGVRLRYLTEITPTSNTYCKK